MKVALLVAMLCASLVLASAAPSPRKPVQVAVKEQPDSNIPDDNNVVADDRQASKDNDDSDTENIPSDIPTEDRITDDDNDDDKKDKPSEDIPVDARATEGEPEQDVETPDSTSDEKNDTTTDKKIPAVVRIAITKGSNDEPTFVQESLSETERVASPDEDKHRKRYVKQSERGTTQPPTTTKLRKTVTIGGTKPATATRHPTTATGTKPRITFKPRGTGTPSTNTPTSRPTTKSTSTAPKSTPPTGPTNTPRSSQPQNKPTTPSTEYPKSNPPTTHAPTTVAEGANTCRCKKIGEPKKQCYSFIETSDVNKRLGTCKPRTCGEKWECLANGKSRNICIRKFATEKVEMLKGTHYCYRRKHAPTPYYVFYKKLTGPSGKE